jgi:thiol-disulfide isomerase/thioredoxin
MKAYLITMQGCGPCQIALEALKKAQPRYAEAMDVVDKDDERVKSFGVMSYPTLVVYDEVAGKVAAQIGGANNLNEAFWEKAFIITEG